MFNSWRDSSKDNIVIDTSNALNHMLDGFEANLNHLHRMDGQNLKEKYFLKIEFLLVDWLIDLVGNEVEVRVFSNNQCQIKLDIIMNLDYF